MSAGVRCWRRRRFLSWVIRLLARFRSASDAQGVVRRDGSAGFADSGGTIAWVIEHLAGSGEHSSLSLADSHGSFPPGQLPDHLGNPALVAGAEPLDVLLVPATPAGWAKLGIGNRLPAHGLHDPRLSCRHAGWTERGLGRDRQSALTRARESDPMTKLGGLQLPVAAQLEPRSMGMAVAHE